jgi:lipoate---protein ligase
MIHFLHLKNTSILEQLRLEEALLRTDNKNWCIINEGSDPAIVMGVSGKPADLIHCDRADIPIIKRFSGGGTVVVDDKTLFVSFIFQKDAVPIKAYPEPILKWSAQLYANAFSIAGFGLRENDYVIGETKCAGNAQYLSKNRWLHHSTFLWDYSHSRMSLLKMPARQPKYRAQRDHGDFIMRLKPHFPSMNDMVTSIRNELGAHFQITDVKNSILSQNFPEHRKSTCII